MRAPLERGAQNPTARAAREGEGWGEESPRLPRFHFAPLCGASRLKFKKQKGECACPTPPVRAQDEKAQKRLEKIDEFLKSLPPDTFLVGTVPFIRVREAKEEAKLKKSGQKRKNS